MAMLAIVCMPSACQRPTFYEANVEVTRIVPVQRDEAGNPVTLDVEVSYLGCPGPQLEVVRGGADFATCAGKYRVGERLKVAISHEKVEGGHYKWTVRNVGDCIRVPDANEAASYVMVRECDRQNRDGTRGPFQCRSVTEKEKDLVDKCPGFRRL